MNRGDVALLVLYCLAVIFAGYFWEFSRGTVVTWLIVGGAVFAVRLWLARRSWRN